MAGIGFELKKIFKKQSISRMFAGAFYSTTVVLGPTLIIIGLLIALYIGLNFFGINYSERALLSSAILYIFVFSVLITAPFNAVFSRYIADKIYSNEPGDILPSYYLCLSLCSVVSALLGIPFSLHLWLVGGVEFLFVLLCYCAFVTMVIILISMIYLHVTKEYRTITLFFILGAVIGIVMGFVLRYLLHVAVLYAILASVAAGLLLIAALQFSYIRRFFRQNSYVYRPCWQYLWQFRRLFLCNLFYSLGLYVHNFVFWAQPGRMVIANSFVSNPTYDMATFLAVFTNLSMTVLFTVMVETKFHQNYQNFNEAVYGSTLAEIRISKDTMFRTLEDQQIHLMGVQAIITIVIYILARVFLPLIGISSNILTIYALLCVAYYVMMVMYNNIVVLFYFNDNWGAMLAALLFFAVTFLGTLVSCRLPIELYGLGIFLGSMVGWTFGFFRIRYLKHHFYTHIFCYKRVLHTVRKERASDIVFKRDMAFGPEAKAVEKQPR